MKIRVRVCGSRLSAWNKFALLHWVDLALPDDEFARVYGENDGADAFGDERERSPYVDLTRRSLYRVFNNSSFDQGGRFYGGWWQNIPSRFRRRITINWAPTRELDYSNLQIKMLYARERADYEGDAYELERVDRSYRELIKRTLFKLINAEGRMRAPRPDCLPPGWSWAELKEAIAEKHAPIASYFGSGVGIELQRIDADIAENVMLSMMERNIVVLPIHETASLPIGRSTGDYGN